MLTARSRRAAGSKLDLRERDRDVFGDAKRVFHLDEDDDVLIAVIADTHLPRGTRTIPARCLELLGRSDLIIHAGLIAVLHDAGPARGRLERLRSRFPAADAVVFGHSHMPLHARDGGFQIFNPGSPIERRRAPAHTMGIAKAERGSLAFRLVDL